jgi:hypothetical protein
VAGIALLVMPACGASAPPPQPSVAQVAATAAPLPPFKSPTVDGLRVTVRPLVVIEPRANDDHLSYDVHFRLNRSLAPESDPQRNRATVKLGGIWAEFVRPEGVRNRNCFRGKVWVRDGALSNADPGSLIRVRIHPLHAHGVLRVEGLILSSEQAATLGEHRVGCAR